MAVDWRITTALATSMATALNNAVNAGTGPGRLRLYTDPRPAGPNVGITTQTLLADIQLNDPAFSNSGGVLTLITSPPVSDPSADATGTATWGRIVDSDGNAVIDGNVGTSNSSINLNTTSIVAGSPVTINSGTITVPTGAS